LVSRILAPVDSLPTLIAEEAALADAGRRARVWTGSPVTYALGASALVVVVDAGDRPQGSAVYAVDEVRLRPPVPDRVVAVLAARRGRLPIRGYVRLPQGCLPLGELRVVVYEFSNRPDAVSTFEQCRLSICEPLGFEMLDRVRPVSPMPLADIGWLELLPDDPIGALRRFVSGWFADVPEAGGVAQAAAASWAPVPSALAALYAAAAGRSEPLVGFNRIFTADQLEPAGGEWVVFGTECQGGWRLLMEAGEPNPAVMYDDLGQGPMMERDRLAGFLLQFLVCDAAVGSPYGGFAAVDREAAQRMVAELRPVPLQPLRWPADPTRLYVGRGVAVAICPALHGPATESEAAVVEVYAGSRHRAGLEPLREPGFDWEHFTG
jgi:hypothetical protein